MLLYQIYLGFGGGGGAVWGACGHDGHDSVVSSLSHFHLMFRTGQGTHSRPTLTLSPHPIQP